MLVPFCVSREAMVEASAPRELDQRRITVIFGARMLDHLARDLVAH